MYVTLTGMFIDVRLLQPEKVPSSMLVRPSEMFIDVKLLQPSYVDIFDYQLFTINTVEKWMYFHLRMEEKPKFNVFNSILHALMCFLC